MKVKDMMTSPVQYCEPHTNLAAAAMKMWDSDCGVLPVVDSEGKVIGDDHGPRHLHGSGHQASGCGRIFSVGDHCRKRVRLLAG